MGVTRGYVIDFNIILANWNFVEGKVLWKRNENINNENSYSFIENNYYFSLDDYEVVGIITENSYSGKWEYTPGENNVGQYIKNIGYGWFINGTSMQDEIHIRAEHSILDAGDGNDRIYLEGIANPGIDVRGGKGDDTFYFGNCSEEYLTGGEGADTYVLDGDWGSTENTILDFNITQDKLEITKSLENLSVTYEENWVYTYDYGNYYGVRVTLTDASGKSTAVMLKDLSDVSAAKNIKLVSGNTQTTLGTLLEGLPAGLKYNADRTVLTVLSTYVPYTLDITEYSGKIKTINAQNVGKYLEIRGNANANTIYAGTMGGALYGNGGNDNIIGGNGKDVISGGADNDTIKGGIGNDWITGDAGNDAIYGGKGIDTLSGGAGNDVFYYAQGDGNDTIQDFEAGKDKIRYTSGGLSKVSIQNQDVLLYNGTGYQKLNHKAVKGQYADIIGTNGKSVRHNFGSYAVANTWNYAAGQGYHGSTKVDTLNISGGKSYSLNLATASLFTSIDNVDASKATAAMTITGGAEANTILGGNKNDTLRGGAGNDTVKGNAGNDKIYGDAGNDALYGGKGNDTLYGGVGSDVFYYATGDGNDTIADFEAGKDKIRYTSGSLSKAQISGNDVLLYNGTGYQKLVGKAVKGQYANIVGPNGKTVRHNFGKAAVANEWDYVAGQGYHGSSKADTLIVSGRTSYNINLANTSLFTSIDNVDASDASAAITVSGSSGANTLVGGKKNDTFKAGAGNDALYGGKGNDTLYGGAGNDVFYYARDDGNDTIADFEAGKDKIRYTSGRLSKVQIVGKDVLLYNDAGYQKLAGKAVKGQYADVIGTDGKTVRHNFGKNATANTWSYVAGQGYHGSSKVDTLTITGAKSCSINLANKALYTSIDTVNAAKAKADMTLVGSAEANTLIGGSEDDALYGGAGNDILQGGNGDDELYAQSGNNMLNGGAGDDYLYGGTGTDTLRGGTGNDIILCGRGADEIQFYKGDGRDIILGANRKDTLYLYNVTDIKSQVNFNLSGNNLVMSFNNNKNDSITLFNWSPGGLTKLVAGNKTYNLQLSGNKVSVK